MDASSLKQAAQPQTAVAKAPQKPMTPLAIAKATMAKYEGEITKALPKGCGWDTKRFLRIATTAISSNPKLAQACALSPITFIGAMMNSAQLGLEPNTSLGQAYLLPYNNLDKNTGKKVPMVQFQIGVYGYIELAYRSGLVESIEAEVRRKNDFWEFELGMDKKLRHIPADGERGEALGYYAVVHLTGKSKPIVKYITKYDVLEHAKRFSKSYNRKTGMFSGPWETDFDAMALKTVLLQALKYVPKASESQLFAKAFTTDATVRTGLDSDSETIKTEGWAATGGDTVDAEYTEQGNSEGGEE